LTFLRKYWGFLWQVPLIANPVTEVAGSSITIRLDATKAAMLNAMNCKLPLGARCACYDNVITSVLQASYVSYTTGSTTWPAIWSSIIDNSERCTQMSSNWEVHVWDTSSKVLLGVVVWWAFSVSLIVNHLVHDSKRNSLPRFYWRVIGAVLPSAAALYLVWMEEETLASIWFILYIASIVAYFGLYRLISYTLLYRADKSQVKDEALHEFHKKLMVAMLTAFSIIAATRLAQLFSGNNNCDDTMHFLLTALVIAFFSITLRMMCAELEFWDREFPAGSQKTRYTSEFRAVIKFSAYWIWLLLFALGVLLLTAMPLDNGDSLLEGAVLFRFVLALLVGVLFLQRPEFATTHNQWLLLQFFEGVARLIAFGATIVYCVVSL